MRHLAILTLVMITIGGAAWSDPVTSSPLPSFIGDFNDMAFALDKGLETTQSVTRQPQFPLTAQTLPMDVSEMVSDAISMPSSVNVLGTDLSVDFLVQEMDQGPAYAYGVGLMFGLHTAS